MRPTRPQPGFLAGPSRMNSSAATSGVEWLPPMNAGTFRPVRRSTAARKSAAIVSWRSWRMCPTASPIAVGEELLGGQQDTTQQGHKDLAVLERRRATGSSAKTLGDRERHRQHDRRRYPDTSNKSGITLRERAEQEIDYQRHLGRQPGVLLVTAEVPGDRRERYERERDTRHCGLPHSPANPRLSVPRVQNTGPHRSATGCTAANPCSLDRTRRTIDRQTGREASGRTRTPRAQARRKAVSLILCSWERIFMTTFRLHR
jgi:hypothetical protein